MSRASSWFSGTTVEDVLSVSAVENIGPATWQKIYQELSSLKKFLSSSQEKLSTILTTDQLNAFIGRSTNQSKQLALIEKDGIEILLLGDKNYPELLKQISDPPLWLYYIGDIKSLDRPLLSIVGSRKCSSYAKIVIETLLPQNLVENITTVSGLAYGVDKQVHQQSISAQSPTVAVLAGGLDSIYPIDHTNLAKQILANDGLLLSEYPPLSRPRPYKFPVRNRIVAGLSRATVVIEAAIKSGSLTTAKSALDYNRDIFAVPADITRPNAAGVNLLLHRGATPLIDADQLFEYFNLQNSQTTSLAVDSQLGELLHLLSPEPLTIDQLITITKQPIEVVLGLVTQLELLGLIYQPNPNKYQKKK